MSSRILIIRLSAIGDVVMATPVAKAIKAASPEDHIVWLVEDTALEVLTGNPSIDEVVVWPKKRWKSLAKEGRFDVLFKEFRSFVSELRKRKFDLALDLQGLLKSAVWAYLSGARLRVGLASREGSGLLMSRVVPREQDQSRISSEYLHLVISLGIEPGDFRMQVFVGEREERFAHEFQKARGLSDGYAVLCPFTTRPQKHWLDDRWAELVERLSPVQGLPAVVLGAAGDAASARRIESLAGGDIINMAGRTTIKEAAAIIRRASLLIGVDTGLTHMAIAFGVPVVALFGSTRPYTDTASESAAVVYKKMDCSPCSRKPVCEGRFECMEAITTGDVMKAVSDVLAVNKR